MKILILTPDSLLAPMGGMGGVVGRILFENIEGDVMINVVNQCFSSCVINNNSKTHSPYCLDNYDPYTNATCEQLIHQSGFITKALELGRHDVVIACDWSTAYAGMMIKQMWNVPFIFWVHLGLCSYGNPSPYEIITTNVVRRIEETACQQADVILHVSDSYINNNPFALYRAKSRVIPNGIDLSQFVQKEKIEYKGEFNIVYLGRFTQQKNIDAILGLEVPDNVHIHLIGPSHEGNENVVFRRVIEACENRSNYHYLGPKYNQEKVDHLCSADAVLMPSLSEPFGLVALEALASKSILLSSFVDGMGDFLTEDCAINCGTTKGTIELAIQKAINLSIEDRKKMVNNGLRVCEIHNWKNIYESFISLISETIKNNENGK